MPEAAPNIVVLGKVAGAYGVQGMVRIQPFADDPSAWGKLPHWLLGASEDADWRQFEVQRCRLHLGALVARLAGVDDRDAAEALKGQLVGVPRAEMPPAGQDSYYWGDLLGLAVVNDQGENLGVVRGLIETGANDVLAVDAGDGKERLLPFVAAVVGEVDLAGRLIRVHWEADW